MFRYHFCFVFFLFLCLKVFCYSSENRRQFINYKWLSAQLLKSFAQSHLIHLNKSRRRVSFAFKWGHMHTHTLHAHQTINQMILKYINHIFGRLIWIYFFYECVCFVCEGRENDFETQLLFTFGFCFASFSLRLTLIYASHSPCLYSDGMNMRHCAVIKIIHIISRRYHHKLSIKNEHILRNNDICWEFSKKKVMIFFRFFFWRKSFFIVFFFDKWISWEKLKKFRKYQKVAHFFQRQPLPIESFSSISDSLHLLFYWSVIK